MGNAIVSSKGGSNERSEIERFLRKCFVRGSCERIELAQVVLRGGTSRVFEWVINDEEEENRSPEHFSEQILEMAEDDARSMRGPTRYLIRVTLEGQTEAAYRKQIVMRGASEDDGAFSETESPDAVGITGMLMRHTEGATRGQILGFNAVTSALLRVLDIAEKKAGRYEEKIFEMIELHTSMQDKKAERDRLAAQEASDAARKDRLLGALEPLAPIVLAKLMPGNATAAKAVGEKEGFKAFLGTIRPDQFDGIMQTLDPEQKMAMMAMLSSLTEEEEKKEPKK